MNHLDPCALCTRRLHGGAVSVDEVFETLVGKPFSGSFKAAVVDKLNAKLKAYNQHRTSEKLVEVSSQLSSQLSLHLSLRPAGGPERSPGHANLPPIRSQQPWQVCERVGHCGAPGRQADFW